MHLLDKKKPRTPKRFLIIFYVLAFGATACNSSTDNEKQSGDTVTPTQTATNDTSSGCVDCHLDILYLTEPEFRSIGRIETRKKIIFQFADTSGTGLLTLRAWANRNHNFLNAVSLHNTGIKTEDLMNKKKVFGNQKLPRPSIQAILNALDVDTNPDQVIAFYPRRDIQNFHVYYEIYVFASLDALKQDAPPFVGKIAETNPSPPASSDPDRVD